MTKVFIGGSRSVTRLNALVRQRLDRIIEKGFPVLVGDANGADKAVQKYLHSRGYRSVEVFCTNGICRNNIGNWPTRAVAAPPSARGFDFYAVKDAQMAREASIGFMLWDGKSRGTLSNIERMLEKNKSVVVFRAPAGQCMTIRTQKDLERLSRSRETRARRSTKGLLTLPRAESRTTRVGLF